MVKPISEIQRYPLRKNETLQGWDSADELLLKHMEGQELEGKRILILNDQFGALSVGLSGLDLTTYTDSFVSAKAIQLNSEGKCRALSELKNLTGTFDFVLIQIPKNMSFFEDELCHLTHHLKASSKIICASMVKHLSPTSFDLLQKYIGATTTSLAQKKARLIFADFQKVPVGSPYPLKVKLDTFEAQFVNHSNLFSREKLDIGTRFFLEHIPSGSYERILDLGCANGVVGIKAKMINPRSEIVFSDDSAMAIESAKINYETMIGSGGDFHWTNCFEHQPKNSIDLVLCNPPFHQQTTVGDFIAWQMFQDAFEVLKPSGVLRVIGNSHLAYNLKLKKLFGNSKMVATNSKFMIVDAVKSMP